MTAFAGANLREEDVIGFLAAGGNALDIPVLAILHDDTDATLAESYHAFSSLRVAAYRCMAPNSQLPIRPADAGGLPLGSHIIGWNEDNEDRSWWDSWWRQVRRQRPDMVIHYGSPNVDMQWPPNEPLEAALDIVDRHIGATFSPPAALIQGKPVWVTEIDVDPNFPDTYNHLPAILTACVNAGIPAFVWGMQPDRPDASLDPTILAAIAAINSNGGIPMSPSAPAGTLESMQADISDLKTKVATIETNILTDDQRYAFLTKAERDLLTGQTQDAAAQVVAVEGGQDASLPAEMAAAVTNEASQDAAANP